MNKKTVRNLIIAGTVGLTATTVGLTTALTACSITATQTFSAESITNLKTAITNAITADRLTRSEFNADMFDIVCDNFVSNDENLGKLVNEVYFSEQNPNRIVIKLNSSIKYSLPEDFNDKSVVLRENTLYITFDTLNFYQFISLSSGSLTQLRDTILNVVSTIGVGNFNETELQNSSTIINAINNLKTSDNTNLGNYINTPTYSQETNSINITINNKFGLYKFVLYSSKNIQVTNDQITINSIITASPESWFTWGTGANANQITGLSDLGKQQKDIILPARATQITNDAFQNNNTLVSVDMSLTSITQITNGVTNQTGTFMNCFNLTNVILPSKLTTIGDCAFSGSSADANVLFNKIENIIIPKTVTRIGNRAFRSSALKTIIIPSNVKTIGQSAFYECLNLTFIKILSSSVTFENANLFEKVPSTCVAAVKNATVQTALKNAGFKGTININPNLN